MIFWSDSIHCGLLAKSFAGACDLIEADRFFVQGLLYDVGHLILDQCVPDACALALERAREQTEPLYQIEREVIGCDYAQVGADLMDRWNFPAGFVAAIRWQNEPSQGGAFPLEVAVMHASITLLRADRDELEPAAAFALIDPGVVEETVATADMVSRVVTEAADALTQTYELLFPEA